MSRPLISTRQLDSLRGFFLKVAHRKEENTDSEQNVKGLEVE